MASMTRVRNGVMWLYPIDAERLEGEVARCRTERGHVAILFDTQFTNQFDEAGGRWVTLCDEHSTVCNHGSERQARRHLVCADWCEACCAGYGSELAGQ